MLLKSLQWAVPYALLSSDRLLNEHLKANTDTNNLSNCLTRSLFDYQIYFSALIRNEDIDRAIEHWNSDQDMFDPCTSLKKLAKYYLEWRGNKFEVRETYLEDWLTLCTQLDPTWIIAWAYVDLLNAQVLDAGDIRILSEHQCQLALPKSTRHVPYADNHVHLNGNGSASISLLDFSLYLDKRPKELNNKWPHRAEYTLFESDLRKKDHLPIVLNLLADILLNELLDRDAQNLPTWEELDTSPVGLAYETLQEIKKPYSPAQQLVLSADDQTMSLQGNRWIIFCAGLLAHKPRDKHHYKHQLAAFIQASQIFRNYMIVSGVGLGQFVEYFRFSPRKSDLSKDRSGLKYGEHALHNDFGSGVKREFRVGPSVVESKDKLPLKLLAKSLSYRGKENDGHFVVHFTRSNKHGEVQTDRIFRSKREECNQYVEQLNQFSGSGTYANTSITNQTAIELDAEQQIDLRKLIRGYDVAGNENELPVEVFAPALRVLRASKIERSNRCMPYADYIQRPFITVHAGEDYSHILSGLRAIDEAVQFCVMGRGDRIGHGLALGIDVKSWARNQSRAYLTVQEHLDNLVWCHQKAVELSQRVDRFHGVLTLLHQKISQWSQALYNKSYSPDVLYRAWLLRRNCPLLKKDHETLSEAERYDWLVDYQEILAAKSDAYKVWDLYLHQIDSADGERCINFTQVVAIDCLQSMNFDSISDTSLRDIISESELDLYEAIQDYLMEQYSEQKIIIEACPTSNILIGRFNSYPEHPIFRWNPPEPSWISNGGRFNRFGLRSGAIGVCLNTDDAGLMPTTIENEHHVIENTAIKDFGVPAIQAEQWIDRIRQKGVDIFDSNHLNWSNS